MYAKLYVHFVITKLTVRQPYRSRCIYRVPTSDLTLDVLMAVVYSVIAC